MPELVRQLGNVLQARGWMLASAESCTAGLIAAYCTEWGGSSAWFDSGFVTYSNAAKQRMLGVPNELLEQHGAVSESVARAMAEGAIQRSQARASVAVTGVAGPSGGSPGKPVGTVWFAWCLDGHTHSQCLQFSGNRHAVRQQTVQHALARLQQWLTPL